MAFYRYFLDPKASVMAHLQDVVEIADKELKNASTAKEGLIKATDGYVKELNELLSSEKTT